MSNDKGNGSDYADDTRPGAGATAKVLSGGVIQVQHGSAQGENDLGAAPGLRSGVHDGGAVRVDAEGKPESHGGVTRNLTTPAALSSDPLANATNNFGSPTGKIGLNTVLDFGGIQEPVKVALSLGWLREDGHGGYVPTGRHVTDLARLRATK